MSFELCFESVNAVHTTPRVECLLQHIRRRRRKKKANIFASRFAPDQRVDGLNTHLDGKLNINVNIAELDSKHPDCYQSFYISAEIDDPKAFLNEHIWPEGITYVRWYRPAEKMQNKYARNAEPRNGSAASVNRD